MDFIMMANSSTSNGSTGRSPYKMVYGQEMGFQIYIITKQIGEIF